MNKILLAVGLIIGIGGIIFSLLPPDAHMSIFGGSSNTMMEGNMEMDAGNMQHGQHNHGIFVTYGLVVGIVGLGIAFAGWKLF